MGAGQKHQDIKFQQEKQPVFNSLLQRWREQSSVFTEEGYHIKEQVNNNLLWLGTL